MKHMKKRMMAALLTAAMVICTFANVAPASAATLTAKQYLSKMEKATSKLKSYEMTQTTVQNMAVDGQQTNSKSVQKTIAFTDPLKAKAVTTTTTKSEGTTSKQKTTVYMKQNAKGKILAYVSLDGKTYDKMDMSSMADSLTSLGLDSYSDAKIVKKNVKVNKINTVQVSAQISGADMGSVFDEMGLSSLLGSDESIDYSLVSPINVTVWIDKKTYLPVKMTEDTTDFVNSFMKLLLQSMTSDDEEADAALTDITVSKSTTTVTYSNFNKATKFTIPKACK